MNGYIMFTNFSTLQADIQCEFNSVGSKVWHLEYNENHIIFIWEPKVGKSYKYEEIYEIVNKINEELLEIEMLKFHVAYHEGASRFHIKQNKILRELGISIVKEVFYHHLLNEDIIYARFCNVASQMCRNEIPEKTVKQLQAVFEERNILQEKINDKVDKEYLLSLMILSMCFLVSYASVNTDEISNNKKLKQALEKMNWFEFENQEQTFLNELGHQIKSTLSAKWWLDCLGVLNEQEAIDEKKWSLFEQSVKAECGTNINFTQLESLLLSLKSDELAPIVIAEFFCSVPNDLN